MGMYKYIVIILFIVTTIECNAQIDPVKFLSIDNPVPTAPAFKILGDDYDAEKTLRPGSFQDFLVSINPILTNKNIPSSFSVEFSPRILGSVFIPNFDEYRNNCFKRFIARTKFSFATGESKTGQSQQVAYGVRLTFYDDTDVLLDDKYTKLMFEGLSMEIVDYAKIKQEYIQKNLGSLKEILKTSDAAERVKKLTEYDSKLSMIDSAWKKAVSAFRDTVESIRTENTKDKNNLKQRAEDSIKKFSLYEKKCYDFIKGYIYQGVNEYDAKYDSANERLKQLETMWTKNILEIGFGHLFNSPNREFDTLQFQKVQFWLTFGLSLAEKTSQLMLSVSGTAAAVSDSSRINTALRWYLGAATKKMYLEVNHVARGGESYQGNILLGGEFSLGNRLWLDVNAGIKFEDKSYFTKNVGFRFGL